MGGLIHPSYHILIENGKKVLISGCRKILEYSPEKIRILLSGESITLTGKELTLYDFFGNEIQISGNIRSLEILSESGAAEKSERK